MRLLTLDEAASWLAQAAGGSLSVNGRKLIDWINYADDGLDAPKTFWLDKLKDAAGSADGRIEVHCRRSSSGKWDNNMRKALGCQSLTATIMTGPQLIPSQRDFRTEISDAKTITDLFKATLVENSRINEARFHEVARELQHAKIMIQNLVEINTMQSLALIEKETGNVLEWNRLKDAVSRRLPAIQETLRTFALDGDASPGLRDLATDGLIASKGLAKFLEQPSASSHPATPIAA